MRATNLQHDIIFLLFSIGVADLWQILLYKPDKWVWPTTMLTLDSQTYSVLSKIIYSYYVVKSLCREQVKRSFFAVVGSRHLKHEIGVGGHFLRAAVRGRMELV